MTPLADDLPLSAPISNARDPVAARPLFDRWLFENRISNRAAARALGLSHETVRLYCLPFDGARSKPSDATRAKIEAWTAGGVPGWTFDDTPEARAAFFTPPIIAPASPAAGQP